MAGQRNRGAGGRRGERSGGVAEALRSMTEALRARFGGLWRDVRRSNLPVLYTWFLAAVLVAAGLVYLAERGTGSGMFNRLFDGVWWALVTIATVGYGDAFPKTDLGRAWAMVLIMGGIVLSALISGAVASIYVERRIREGKGLLEVKARDHLILCGFNPEAESVLKGLEREGWEAPVVLVNLMEAEAFDALASRYHGLELRFVRGDFTQEATLRKAAAQTARAAVFVPDASGGTDLGKADERTVLGCLALKGMAPDCAVSAGLLKPASEQHLKRAGVDNVVVEGEFSGFLLASGTRSKGVALAARRILSDEGPGGLRQVLLPKDYVGKSFAEASGAWMAAGRGLLLGILSEEKGVSLDNLLSDDSSAIDAFIKRKFQEAQIDLAEATSAGAELRLPPEPGYLLREGDLAFVLGAPAEPSEPGSRAKGGTRGGAAARRGAPARRAAPPREARP